MSAIFEIIVGMVMLVNFVFMVLFMVARHAIIANYQEHHKTMSMHQVRRSQRFKSKSEIRKNSRMRWIRRVQIGSVVLGLSGLLMSRWLFSQTTIIPVVKFGSVLAILIGGWVEIITAWKLNRFIIDIGMAKADQDAKLGKLLVREWRYFKGLAISLCVAVTCMAGLVLTFSAPVKERAGYMALNTEVQRVQRIKSVQQKTTTREKMAMFTMYLKAITGSDLDMYDTTYNYHVIPDGKATWYVLTGKSMNTGYEFFYLVKVDAHQNVQMYYFPDKRGDKTALHGLVPKYETYEQTQIKLGSLIGAYMSLSDFSTYVQPMHAGANWQLTSKK